MTTAEEQENDVDQQRIDELQNQYFREKLANVDPNRLKEAQEYLERNRRPLDESVERVRPKPTTANRLPHEDRRV